MITKFNREQWLVWRENMQKEYLERYPEDTKLEDFEDWLDYKKEQNFD